LTKILACGFVNFDMIAAGLPSLPPPGGVVYAPNGVQFRLGGHTANFSVDLLQLGAPPGSVSIAAAVGKDIAGRFIRDFLLSKGVECLIQEAEGAETGRSIVLVQSGRDRCFVINTGANADLSLEHVLGAIQKTSPGILYLACGILGAFDTRIGDVLKLCRSRGIATILDAVEPLGKGWDFVLPALPYVDVMHSNRQELEGVTGSSDPRQGLGFLAGKGVALPVVTDGPGRTLALFKGRHIAQPSFEAEAVDPTGAGDAFSAGIAYKLGRHLDEGRPLRDLGRGEVSEMLLYAQAAGAACVGEIGTTPGVTSERVSYLIRDQGARIRAGTSSD
jgi:ribokinase